MDYERIRTFVKSYIKDDSDERLRRIYEDAAQRGIPVIREDTRDYLRNLLWQIKPGRILEIGTAVGYSALFIDSVMSEVFQYPIKEIRHQLKNEKLHRHEDEKLSCFEGEELSHFKGEIVKLCRIDTIELDEGNYLESRRNIEALGAEDRICVYKGDAAVVLDEIYSEGDKYDLIFIDAAKAQYQIYFDKAIRMAHAGSVIVTDNVLESGLVLESHFLVEKRDRTIHDKLREFLYNIKNDIRVDTSILSIGDGIAVSVVK